MLVSLVVWEKTSSIYKIAASPDGGAISVYKVRGVGQYNFFFVKEEWRRMKWTKQFKISVSFYRRNQRQSAAIQKEFPRYSARKGQKL